MSASDYLNEIICFGGEYLSRGRVIQILQAEGHGQRLIDAYMMGAKAV
jgi:hypothetical protein